MIKLILMIVFGILLYVVGLAITNRIMEVEIDDDMFGVNFIFWWIILPIYGLICFYWLIRGD